MTGGTAKKARRSAPRILSALAMAVALVAGLLAAAPTSAGAVSLPGAVPSTGCGAAARPAVVEEEIHLQIGASDRWYLRTIPSGHDGTNPIPVVVDFHGLSEGARIHTVMSEMSRIAERDGFVVAFPHGRFEPVRWDVNPATDPNEDLVFVNGILDQIAADLCVDRSRVYAMGLSYGAFMTSHVTCTMSNRFAAVAPVAGVRAPEPCPQQRAVPLVSFHGTADTILPFNPGGDPDIDGPGYPAAVRAWAARYGCAATPVDTEVSDEVLRRVYDCPDDADVEFYVIEGGGHAWPGSAFSQQIENVVGYTTMDIHASEVAWAFFQRFQLPCDTEVPCPQGTPPPTITTPTSTVPPTPSSVAPVLVTPRFTA